MLQDGNRLVVFGSQLIGVLIVVVGMLTQQAELHTRRPVGSKTQVTAEADQKGDRFARLWDDPLADLPAFEIAAPRNAMPPADGPTYSLEQAPPAVGPSRMGLAPPTASQASEDATLPSEQAAGVVAELEMPQAPSVPKSSAPREGIFLWNILDARPLPEVTERRLRTRYAIVSALMTIGYLPVRDSFLSPLARTLDGPSASLEPFGYFETFEAKDKPFQRVCLIWTPKHSTAVPIAEGLQRQIRTQICQRGDLHDSAPLHTLHHGSSQDLATYLTPVLDLPEEAQAHEIQSKDSNISFVRATIPLERLHKNTKLQVPPSLRPIMTDDHLVKALVHELSLRIPELNRKTEVARVIVFTESDTKYSRAIAAEFADQLKGRAKAEVYSYLRGLDGRPEEFRIPAKTDSTKSNDPAASLLHGRAISENSFGTSQFDYLRRLALYLDQAKRKTRDGPICAVGILGSDIYDKMLVLQAIRPELPAAIFFTTDLDALYLERENEGLTRNLVVASADSLDVNEREKADDQWNLPPMRDSYQTVLVKHIWTILASSKAEAKAKPRVALAQPPARLFEIVAGRSIDLDPKQEGLSCEGTSLLGKLPKLSGFIFLLALGNGFLILWAISTRGSPNAPSAAMKSGARTFVYVEICLAFAGLIFLLCKVVSKGVLLLGEPLILGASIWPSVMIRLLAFLVAILLLLIASYAFVAHGPLLEADLKAAFPPSYLALPLATSLPKQVFRFCCFVLWEKHTPHSDQNFTTLLRNLFDQRKRQNRIMIASVAYLVVSMGLFFLWPPAIPARGAASFLIEKVVLALGVALYIIHLIYCLDLHLSALTLLRTLRSLCSPTVQQATAGKVKARQMLTAVSKLTAIIGKTLLYPLTVLILIILSRLRIFDTWTMTPSLTITFTLGAALLVAASLVLWLEGAGLKRDVLAANGTKRQMGPKEKEQIVTINDGVFAAWHHQPIFAAILSVAAVFGSLSIAVPLVRLFVGSS